MEIKRIETYSLYEFCQAVEQSVIEGWRFDFESNELFPTAFGSMLVTGMVKAPSQQQEAVSQPKIKGATELVTEDNAEVEAEVNTEDNQVKRGRKPK
jgi:hypothetical protein